MVAAAGRIAVSLPQISCLQRFHSGCPILAFFARMGGSAACCGSGRSYAGAVAQLCPVFRAFSSSRPLEFRLGPKVQARGLGWNGCHDYAFQCVEQNQKPRPRKKRENGALSGFGVRSRGRAARQPPLRRPLHHPFRVAAGQRLEPVFRREEWPSNTRRLPASRDRSSCRKSARASLGAEGALAGGPDPRRCA